jgi:PAS domain S-box-containing protein
LDFAAEKGCDVHTSGMTNEAFEALAARPDAVRWTMALTGEITEISDSIFNVRGLTSEEAKVQAADQIHPPASLQTSLAYFERFSRALLEGRVPEPFHADLEYFHVDGSLVPCEVMALPVLDDNGQVRELIGVSVPKR